MPVTIGTIQTFPNVEPDKSQVLKIGEECMEVFSAWENLCKKSTGEEFCARYCSHMPYCSLVRRVVDEIADVMQACANLAAALGVDDMRGAMEECERRNRERGRM